MNSYSWIEFWQYLGKKGVVTTVFNGCMFGALLLDYQFSSDSTELAALTGMRFGVTLLLFIILAESIGRYLSPLLNSAFLISVYMTSSPKYWGGSGHWFIHFAIGMLLTLLLLKVVSYFNNQ